MQALCWSWTFSLKEWTQSFPTNPPAPQPFWRRLRDSNRLPCPCPLRPGVQSSRPDVRSHGAAVAARAGGLRGKWVATATSEGGRGFESGRLCGEPALSESVVLDKLDMLSYSYTVFQFEDVLNTGSSFFLQYSSCGRSRSNPFSAEPWCWQRSLGRGAPCLDCAQKSALHGLHDLHGCGSKTGAPNQG